MIFKSKKKKIIFDIDSTGTKLWFKNSQYHRLNGPALIYPDGNKYWYKNHKLHREDGPALIYANGDSLWYKNDLFIKSKSK